MIFFRKPNTNILVVGSNHVYDWVKIVYYNWISGLSKSTCDCEKRKSWKKLITIIPMCTLNYVIHYGLCNPNAIFSCTKKDTT